MPIAATGAEVGIFLGQGGRLDSVDGVGIRILGRDGAAALALADERTLRASVNCPAKQHGEPRLLRNGRFEGETHRGFGLVIARELLELRELLFGEDVARARHPERGGASVVASVLLTVAGG